MTRRLLCAALFLGVGAATIAPGIAGANTTIPGNPASGCPGVTMITAPGVIGISDPTVVGTGTVNATYYQLAPPFTGPATVTYSPGANVVIQTGTAPGFGMLSGSYDTAGGVTTRCDLIPSFFFQP